MTDDIFLEDDELSVSAEADGIRLEGEGDDNTGP
jgi:hypothetical protein